MPPTQPSPGSHPSRLLPKTHPACIAQVSLAGSTTIDDEKTDYFTEFGWTGFKRCELRLEQQPTFEPHAALALAVCWPNRARCKPPSHAPSCRNRAALLLVVHRGQLVGAAAMLLDVAFPRDVVLQCTLSSWSTRCWRDAGETVKADEARTSRLWGDLYSLVCLTECRIGLACIFSVQGAWDRREPIPGGATAFCKKPATPYLVLPQGALSCLNLNPPGMRWQWHRPPAKALRRAR